MKMDEEFLFRWHLLAEATQKRLLMKIPTKLWNTLDIDEMGSVLLGLLEK